jgi:Bacterial dnaA protein helix-turn-helix
MRTPLHAAVATPSQRLAAAARREREKKIAAKAHPDAPIACPSASARSQQAKASRPSLPPAAQTRPERLKKIHAPIKTWFWIVDEINPPHPLKLSIEEIQNAVERHCKVGHIELISARRTADVVRPRQIAMFLARRLTASSLPVIGRKFGDRDHTTVLHAVRKIEALRSRDKILAGDLDAIARALTTQVA